MRGMLMWLLLALMLVTVVWLVLLAVQSFQTIGGAL